MQYIYFTKTLKDLAPSALVEFCKETGVDGLDLAVRPGYPIEPANVLLELPKFAAIMKQNKLDIPLVSAPTSLVDAESKEAKSLFEACALAGVPMIKIGYFTYKGSFNDDLQSARKKLQGFAKLAQQTKVKVVYHTHSGANIGNNAVSLKELLTDFDPHHVGAFADTGHLAVNGGPIKMELEILRPWLSIIAIKDILWEQAKGDWAFKVIPAGSGIVRWNDVSKGIKDAKFQGTIVLHGEYEAASLPNRKDLAKKELAFLKKQFE
ncbi:sugar phosphate isomerase/epimerase [bacterium]|nr:sugar phosphate isomerase/epimerase [Gemmataceae bacterium]NBS89452.1 sugar phosphate isomerase/epimerase [bacterium]NBT60491.1 sugar phosphate isomerase/epimerase [Planctomycetia bacterium]